MTDDRAVIDEVGGWAVLRTAARWEKAVAGQLTAAGVPAFLPLLTRVSRTKGRSQTARVPVFPGYVFCGEAEFRENVRVPAACRRLIAQLLRAPDREQLKGELRSIAELLANRQLLQERVYGAVGDTVRIVGGPLVGSLGRIVRLKAGTGRVILEVSFLGARMEAIVDERLLEKALPARVGALSRR